jgi:hypothetical protein
LPNVILSALYSKVCAIKSAIQTATAPLHNGNPHATSRVTSWAQVAAKAGPPPGHVTPPDSVSSSRSPLTTYKGREVIVKLLDHAIAERFRQFTPIQLKNKINSILHVTPSVRGVKIAAANQLKSGDVAVFADSIEHATILQTHTEWAKGLGPRAQVIRTTYGAIVNGITVNTINMNDQQGTIQRILADNHTKCRDVLRGMANQRSYQEKELLYSYRIYQARAGK